MKKVEITIFSILILAQVWLSIYDFKYVFGSAGALLLIIFWLKQEKQRVDDGGRANWIKYFSREWDDFAIAWASTLIFVSVQEYVYFGAITFMEWDYDKYVDLYFDGGEQVIAATIGWTSTKLVDKLWRKTVEIDKKI